MKATIYSDIDWIATRVGKAQEAYPSVTSAVVARINELLKSHLSERQLNLTELRKMAEELISDMTAPSSSKKAEARHED